MLDGDSVAKAFVECGITHVVWIPDTVLGTWDAAFSANPDVQLVRVCREGEAFAVAAGLYLGGKKPIILIQCTGLFEAGDSLRNFLHDLKLPLFMVIGLRSWYAHQERKSADSCPVFAEPIMQAWKAPYVILDDKATADDLKTAYLEAQRDCRCGAVLLAE